MIQYCIIRESDNNLGTWIVMVDRTKYKTQWWSESIDKAMLWGNIHAAEKACSNMKYGNCQVTTKEDAIKKLQEGRQSIPVRQRKSWMEIALHRKLQEWHDDDWYEGIND